METARLRLIPLTTRFANTYDERECHSAETHWSEHGFGHWALLERKSGAFVGSAKVHFAYPGVEGISTEEIEVGIEILARYQRQGYATEAVKAAVADIWRRTSADHVVAYTTPDHAASIKLLEKLGFRFRSIGRGRDDQSAAVYTLPNAADPLPRSGVIREHSRIGMKLGIGLPHTLPWGLDRSFLLEWASRADELGFHSLGTLDRPNYDSWESLTTLAGVAALTKRIRLATTILQLSNRNEVLVAKQAAVVDQLSGGRLDLGVAPGTREDDFAVFGAEFSQRRRFRRQIARIRAVWDEARASTEEHGNVGPAPVQVPGPPIWIGAGTPEGFARATEIGDGFVFSAVLPPERIGELLPELRTQAEANGKPGYTFHAIAYCGVGDPDEVLEVGGAQLRRYYRNPSMPYEAILHRGSTTDLAAVARRYADTGLDSLILLPQVPSLDQVELLGRDVLRDYR